MTTTSLETRLWDAVDRGGGHSPLAFESVPQYLSVTTTMTGRLTHSIQQAQGENRVVLSGEITEEADFTPLLELKARDLVVDLSQITRINSSGLREWIEFARACNSLGARLILERCSPVVVNQLNMIWNFAGRDGKVRSVFAPYFCEKCHNEHLELIDLGKTPRPTIAGELPCAKCGSTLEFDDVADIYLQFQRATQ
jgi:anti-anti-sigma regulatory factor